MVQKMDDAKLKTLLKTAVAEVLEERRDLVRDAVAEAIEDIAMVHAINEGSRSAQVSRATVFKLLRKGR